MKTKIQTNAAPPAIGTYSQAVRVGSMVFVAAPDVFKDFIFSYHVAHIALEERKKLCFLCSQFQGRLLTHVIGEEGSK